MLRTGAGLLVIGVLVVAGWFALEARNLRASDTDVLKASVWIERIVEVGDRAYEEMLDAGEDLGGSQKHLLAHAYGEALFDVYGIDGFSHCGHEFSYGCVHEFVGLAIHAFGEGVIHDLNERCRETFGDVALYCQHGIGHGLVAYLGYNEESLLSALEFCESLSFGDGVGGCPGGAFMEFNLRTMLDDGAEVRPVPDDPILKNVYPCNLVSGTDALSCGLRIPQWWFGVLHQGPPEEKADVFVELGKRCREEFDDSDMVRACFLGIGNVSAPEADFDALRAVEYCMLSAKDNDVHDAFCRSLAAQRFALSTADPDDPTLLCEGLSADLEDMCLGAATLDEVRLREARARFDQGE